jgi:hypothetical protein
VGPDWRLHATYDPVAGRFTNLELTDRRGAESFGRTAWCAGDVAIGDRDYARPPGLRHILATGAEFIVRTGWKQLRLLNAGGAPVAWEPIFDTLATGEIADQAVLVDYSGQGRRSRGKATFPARLVVLRLSPEATERAAKAVYRKHSRCTAGKLLLPLTVRAAGYLMLLTSLPSSVPATEVLAAYRLRWQVELAFKRMKSLLGFNRLPAKDGALARSWLLAHLVFALLIDDTAQTSWPFPSARPAAPGRSRPFSPWRVVQVLRDALLAVVRGVPSVALLRGGYALLAERLLERPRRRRCQFGWARESANA